MEKIALYLLVEYIEPYILIGIFILALITCCIVGTINRNLNRINDLLVQMTNTNYRIEKYIKIQTEDIRQERLEKEKKDDN